MFEVSDGTHTAAGDDHDHGPAANVAPVADDDTAIDQQETPVDVDVLDGDTDADNDD